MHKSSLFGVAGLRSGLSAIRSRLSTGRRRRNGAHHTTALGRRERFENHADIRTYRAADMQQAMAIVRRELGSEAVILHTRDCRKGGLLGWRRRREVEVTASRNVNVVSRIVRPLSLPASPAAGPRPSDAGREITAQLGRLQQMVSELHRGQQLGRMPDVPTELLQVYTELVEQELGEATARELISRLVSELPAAALRQTDAVRAKLRELVAAELQTSGPMKPGEGRPRVVALVGSTGVGKTTTVAKLAANFRLRDGVDVALVTVDTYRIAAVEQLRTYAEIIDLPMKVVMSPREMRASIEELGSRGLILIDTAGRSPKDELKIKELRSFLNEAQPAEVHLVVSAVAGAASLRATIERFGVLQPSALAITKLDEAAHVGGLYPILKGAQLPVSYLTTGQDVPEDIEAAEPTRLARLMLGEESLYR